jgi:hypothetical protein
LGKYWRKRPLVFSFEPLCHGEWGVTEIDVDAGFYAEEDALGHRFPGPR